MLRKILPVLFVVGLAVQRSPVSGHGRLLDPPSRSSLWRYEEFGEFNPEKNFEDNQLFCGGFVVQHQYNDGKCGICGDPYNQTEPRDNEDGGIYGKGIITRRFKSGQIIPVDVEITASHGGFWELRLCPEQPATQKCLDRYLLQFAGSTETRINVIGESGEKLSYSTAVVLPRGLKCSRCVLQWHYHTGNRWGECEDGHGENGCGPQETFRGCSDISIS